MEAHEDQLIVEEEQLVMQAHLAVGRLLEEEEQLRASVVVAVMETIATGTRTMKVPDELVHLIKDLTEAPEFLELHTV